MAIHLLSCGTCKRQFDVTSLRLGDEIRCVCGTVLNVGHPRVVETRGTACGHCGSRVANGDTDCSSCHTKLSAQDKVEAQICPSCDARRLDDSGHCEGCGSTLHPSALPPVPRDGRCPRCDGDLCVHLGREAAVIECTGCGGIWAQRDALDHLIGGASAPSDQSPSRATIGAHAEEPEDSPSEDRLPCLTCGVEMKRFYFRHAGLTSNIVLDACRRHGVWFDHDELRRSVEFAMDPGAGFNPESAFLAAHPGALEPIVTRKSALREAVEEGCAEGVVELLFDGVHSAGSAVGWAILSLLE